MDLQEFKTQVYPLKDKLFRFVRRMLDHTEEAEDTVQDVFIRLWNIREKLDEYRSVEALAMVTARNLCLDRIKSKRYTVDAFDDHRTYLENLPERPRPDHAEMAGLIRQAIRELPEPQKTIVHLRDIEGYEFAEISEVTGMNENAIRVALSRARKKLREALIKTEAYEYQRD
ncbi:MAG TPA: sigma-70 family RNA polymerase sigma factor [Bacteroidales bacterium]|nr:sigma-70 family RNA polymerase sigma factor [Bacteroidales bacterium]